MATGTTLLHGEPHVGNKCCAKFSLPAIPILGGDEPLKYVVPHPLK